MKGVFDLLIADEVHEVAAAESIQGNTFGTLAAACRYTIALTGTLIGGKASDLHAPLWRMSADLLNQRALTFTLTKAHASHRSPEMNADLSAATASWNTKSSATS